MLNAADESASIGFRVSVEYIIGSKEFDVSRSRRVLVEGFVLLLLGVGASTSASASERDIFMVDCMKEATKSVSVEIAASYCSCCADQLTLGSSFSDTISFCRSREINRARRSSPTNTNDLIRDILNAPNPYSGSTFQWSP